MKDLPSDAPRLDPLPFVVVDGVLVGAAALIGWQADAPLGVGPLASITALVGLGAIAALYPFVVNHARRQEEAVQERANQIEALARTIGASAEQISIAVANLPAIAENSSRQLKASEQLPSSLKDQLAALQHQLSATASEENAALRHELDTLRGAETARLAAALDGITRATADLARLEALAAKHSAALDAAIAHLPRVADAFTHQAGEALRRETATAVAALHGAAAEAGAALAAATDDARAAFDRGVRDAVTHLATQASSNPPFPAHAIYSPVIVPESPAPSPVAPEPLLFVAETTPPIPLVVAPETVPAPEPAPETAPTVVAPPEASPEQEPAPAPVAEEETIDDAALDEPVAEELPPEPAPAPIASAPEPEPEPEPAPQPETEESEVPASAPEAIPEPIATAATETPESEPESASKLEPEPETESPAAATAPADEPDSASPDSAPEPDSDPAPAAEPALSHDGYTRLIATAYIGIGNKLFVRGDGPGLRRDKGVPLQFVSIGKWRWESAELLFPAKVKLYKNDQTECVALGEITLEPGHHHEVSATF